jgi:hypothetical protein
MRQHRAGTSSNRAARLYALLMRLYPPAHRRAFGQQMLQTFRDQYRDVVETHEESAQRFWRGVLADAGRSLFREYLTALAAALGERTGPMKTGGSVVLTVVAGLMLMLGVRVWLSPAVLSAPHGGGTALGSVAGLALLLLTYALLALGLPRVRLGVRGPERAAALQRATLIGALLGGGALAAIAVDTLGSFESPVSLGVWALVALAAPIGWGWAGLIATRAGGSWRLGLVVALWSGMVSALVGAAGEVASTLLALPRLVQHELSNPDYLYWHQPDVQSYAIASALAVAMIGLVLAPIMASIAGSVGGRLGKAGGPVELSD